MIRETRVLIWFLPRSTIPNEEIMSFENSDRQMRRSFSEMTPSLSFLVKTDVNSAIVMLAMTKIPSVSFNISSIFSEPSST